MKRTMATGFTLVEVVLALAIAGLLAISVFAMISASTSGTAQLATESLRERREETLTRLLRQSFANLPIDGGVVLTNIGGDVTTSAALAVTNAPGGMGFLADGEWSGGWILGARPQADGTATLALLKLPVRPGSSTLGDLMEEGPWLPVFPGISRATWRFRTKQNNTWSEAWNEGSGRPDLVALSLEFADGSAASEHLFWLPAVVASTSSAPSSSTINQPVFGTRTPDASVVPTPPASVPSVPSVPGVPTIPTVPVP